MKFVKFSLLKSVIRVGSIIGFVGLLFILPFQNCSEMVPSGDISPNVAPMSGSANSNRMTVEPGVKLVAFKSASIGGRSVEQQAFAAGAVLYAIVDDQCVVDRRDEIFSETRYFIDPYLVQNFNFSKPVGTFNKSLVVIKTVAPLAEAALADAVRLDECILSLNVSVQYFEVKLAGETKSGSGAELTRAEIGMTEAVAAKLRTLNQNKKVNVGLTVAGISKGAGLPLSSNLEGIPFGGANADEGTYYGSVIAGTKGDTASVAPELATLTPHILGGRTLNPATFFNGLKDLVNRGAEIILIPQEIVPSDLAFCSPVIGEALFWAVERGAFIVVQAGTETLPGMGPSDVIGPRDYNLWTRSKTNYPGCWARYFRGVVSVAGKSMGLDQVAANSNWGVEGAELLAPSSGVLGIDSQKRPAKVDTPAAGAALVAASAAHIVSFYKGKNWHWSPWLIEDVLLNGSRTSSTLASASKSVRRSKILDLTMLTTYLENLNSLSEEQARTISTDNPEAGQGINLGSVRPGEKPIRLDVFTKTGDVYFKDRAQFQAVFYYSSGAVEVVTERVKWTSSDSTNFPVDSAGVVTPKSKGNFTVTASDLLTGMQGSFASSAVDYDRISGLALNDELLNVYLVPKDSWQVGSFLKIDATHYRLKGSDINFSLRGVYKSGVVRPLSTASVAFTFRGEPIANFAGLCGPRITDSSCFGESLVNFYGGAENTMTVFYRGRKFDFSIAVDPVKFEGWHWDVAGLTGAVTPTTPPKNVVAVSDSARTIFAGLFYPWFGKKPLCRFATGITHYCPGYAQGWESNRQDVSTLYTIGKFSSGTDVIGKYKLLQRIDFRGAGASAVIDTESDVEVAPIALTPYFRSIVVDLKDSVFTRTAADRPGVFSGVQLAPSCLALGYQHWAKNEDLGADVYRFSGYWPFAPGHLTMKSDSIDVSAELGTQSGTPGILMNRALPNISYTFQIPAIPNSISFNSPYRFVDDPMDSGLGPAALKLDANGWVTPKALPALPSQPSTDSVCSNAPDAKTGFRGGDGTEASPFIICSYQDLAALSAYRKMDSLQVFSKLGANISLADVRPMLNSSGYMTFFASGTTRHYLNGANFRIMNANYLDREASFSFLDVDRAENLVITNNNIVARQVTFLAFSRSSREVMKFVYAYDNTIEAEEYNGIAYWSALNSYSKNTVSYRRSYSGVSSFSAAQSFAHDTVRYIGIVGVGSAYGVARSASHSGAATSFINGAAIGGVASEFCYKCYSKVSITTANASLIGGIVLRMNVGAGRIEIGDSEAEIIAVGNTIVGGLVGSSELTTNNPRIYILDQSFQLGLGHLHVVNSRFSGKIISSFIAGGVIGDDRHFAPAWFSDVVVDGAVSGESAKIGSLTGRMETRCNSERRVLRLRSVTVPSGLSKVGDYFGASSGEEVPF